MKPHPFYQACKVSGKNSTPCIEKDIDSTTTIEIELSSTNNLIARYECIIIVVVPLEIEYESKKEAF